MTKHDELVPPATEKHDEAVGQNRCGKEQSEFTLRREGTLLQTLERTTSKDGVAGTFGLETPHTSVRRYRITAYWCREWK